MTIYTAQNVKAFMAALLKSDTFDKFYIREITVNTFALFNINGQKTDENGKITYCTWGEIKPYAFDIIKGNRLPRLIKIVFSLDPDSFSEALPGASALFLNVTYENDSISCITGISMKTFTLDKRIEYEYDSLISRFFKQNNISVSTQSY